MKIDSAVNFFEDADASDAIVIFKGSGSVDGADTKVIKVIDLEGSNTIASRLLGEDFLIKVKTEVDDFEFNLSEVENQLTWPNTRAGADAAIKAIRSWKKKSSVGYELPDPATADPGHVVGVVDGAFAFVNPPAPTNPKVYRAMLMQSGTDAPVANILENTASLGLWQYTNPNVYYIALPEDAEYSKVFVQPKYSYDKANGYNTIFSVQGIIGSFKVYIETEGEGDINLNNEPIEILIYD